MTKGTKFGECPLQFIDYLLKLREKKFNLIISKLTKKILCNAK